MRDTRFGGASAFALLFALGALGYGAPASAQGLTGEICDQDEDGFIDGGEATACGRGRLEELREEAGDDVGYLMSQQEFFGELEDAEDPEALLVAADTDQDGQVSEEEWQTFQEERFAAATEESDGRMAVEDYDRFSRGEDVAATATADSDMPEGTDFAPVLSELESQGQFSTLVQAIESAGLAEELSGQGPFTVFAPTDDAFDQLGDGAVDQLMQGQNGEVAELVKHHIVTGAHPSDALPDQLEPMAGDPYGVSMVDQGAVLAPQNGEQIDITQGDIRTESGYVHAIGGVLVPDSVASALEQGQQSQ